MQYGGGLNQEERRGTIAEDEITATQRAYALIDKVRAYREYGGGLDDFDTLALAEAFEMARNAARARLLFAVGSKAAAWAAEANVHGPTAAGSRFQHLYGMTEAPILIVPAAVERANPAPRCSPGHE